MVKALAVACFVDLLQTPKRVVAELLLALPQGLCRQRGSWAIGGLGLEAGQLRVLIEAQRGFVTCPL